MNISQSFDTLELKLKENSDALESAFVAYFENKNIDKGVSAFLATEKYSLLGGGKRIRPFLVNEVCTMLGGDVRASMPFAMAVEMIHTYSLIHDDLPCMDDDDMRRGKPSNHKVFGEAYALLAGDALLTNAFALAASNKYTDSHVTVRAVELIAEAAGDAGMIGGQFIDLEGEMRRLSLDELLMLHNLKTGKMIELSAILGCLAAGYGEDTAEFEAVKKYAQRIGLAFQVIDDILDVEGDEVTVGKTLKSDAENQKTTFLSFFDIDKAKRYAQSLTEEAKIEISKINQSEMLCDLAKYLLLREK
ncbi:MAG: polyprenyl synthetase family protein [Ruminococcaceae bacterium]|nr:polyprenyl synthetase family protein [Oscillospiraceae bacterium]